MQLPAQLQEFLFERGHLDPQLPRDLEQVEVAALFWRCCRCYAHKIVPFGRALSTLARAETKKVAGRAAAYHWLGPPSTALGRGAHQNPLLYPLKQPPTPHFPAP